MVAATIFSSNIAEEHFKVELMLNALTHNFSEFERQVNVSWRSESPSKIVYDDRTYNVPPPHLKSPQNT